MIERIFICPHHGQQREASLDETRLLPRSGDRFSRITLQCGCKVTGVFFASGGRSVRIGMDGDDVPVWYTFPLEDFIAVIALLYKFDELYQLPDRSFVVTHHKKDGPENGTYIERVFDIPGWTLVKLLSLSGLMRMYRWGQRKTSIWR